MLKNFCFSEKKLPNAILRAKLKNMKMFLSNEMKCFAIQKTDVHDFEVFLQEKVF